MKNHTQKKLFPTLFKTSKLSISLYNSLNFYSVRFTLSPSRWIPKHIETKVLTTGFYLLQKFFFFRKTWLFKGVFIIKPPSPLVRLWSFSRPPPPPLPPKVRLFWLELTLSPSISMLVKFREKKLVMNISIFGWAQRVF